MGRHDRILKYADLDSFGIEIAPFYNPLVPKADGRRVLILDVFETAELRRKAIEKGLIGPEEGARIEEVDLVGSASEIQRLVEAQGLAGEVGYIVSSHNFEHIPNPIKFLQGCAAVLAPGGVLGMAVPDYRACFDHYRFPTRLAEWLEAWFEDRQAPTPAQVFDGAINRADYFRFGRGSAQTGVDMKREHWRHFEPARCTRAALEAWRAADAEPNRPYEDAHCSVFFDKTLELMVRDLIHMGLLDLELVEMIGTHDTEFYIHLRKPLPGQAAAVDETAYYRRRAELLREITASLGGAGFPSDPVSVARRWLRRARMGLKAVGR